MMKLLSRAQSAPSHMERSYVLQRKGMAWLGLAFPAAFLLSSVVGRTAFQDSISDYYWTLGLERNFFVGALFSIGAFLYLYKGASWAEDRLLDLAGVLAILVAFVPTPNAATTAAAESFSWHGLFAATFFVCIALYCVSMTFVTLPVEGRARRRRERFKAQYILCTIAILASVAFAVVFHFTGVPIFWPEAFAVWAFSAFWYLQTRELDPSRPWIPLIWKQNPAAEEAA